jgi:hypothetical protein
MANDERYDPLAAIVRVANRLCLQEGICLPDQTPSPFDESELKEIKLDEGELARLRELLATRKESFVSLFSDWEDAPRRA